VALKEMMKAPERVARIAGYGLLTPIEKPRKVADANTYRLASILGNAPLADLGSSGALDR